MQDKPGQVFATWFAEILSMVQELEARRGFDADVSAWLVSTDRVKDFEAFRHARAAKDDGSTDGSVVTEVETPSDR